MAEGAKITPNTNGPYHVTGNFTIVMPNGEELQTNGETWLCRCGGSTNKPFCDGTHSKIGFKAAEEAVAKQEAKAAKGAKTDGYQAVADEGDITEGDIYGIEVNGEAVVIGRVDGEIYAIGGVCTHQYARLEDGALEDDVVMCPLHNSGFNIKTGEAVRYPATEPVPRYGVKTEGGKVFVTTQPIEGTTATEAKP